MASQHMEDGSFPLKPKNRSSVPTLCFRIISYLNGKGYTHRLIEAKRIKNKPTINKVFITKFHTNTETSSQRRESNEVSGVWKTTYK